MAAAQSLDQLLDSAALLLESKHALVLSGGADSLPVLSTHLASLLSQLLTFTGSPQLPAQQQRLDGLRKQALIIGALLNRRQSDVRRSLAALATSAEQITEMQHRRVYAPAGQLVSSMHTRAMGSA